MSKNATKVIFSPVALLIFAFIISLIYAVFYIISPFINSSHKINAEIAKIEAKGEPVKMPQLLKPPVPDNENAAKIYDKAFQLIETPEYKKDYEIIEKYISPENGQRDMRWFAQAKKAVERNREIISLIEEAQTRPQCCFPVDWSHVIEAEFPHFSKTRDLARYLRADSLINASSGNMDDAVNSILLQIKLIDSIKDEPGLMPMLIKIVISKMMCRTVYEILSYGSITEAQAVKLYNAISEIEYRSDLSKALRGERVIGISLFQDIYQKGPEALGDIGGYPTSSKRVDPKQMKTILGPDEIFYLKYMAERIKNADLSYREAKKKWVDVGSDPKFPKYAILSSILMPAFSNAHVRRDETIAELAGAQILIACKAYHDRYHSYPQTLNELKTKLGWKLPEDVFSGKDMMYKSRNRGFVLYSIGSDLKDNGGHQPKERGDYENGDDIVWKIEK